MVWGARICALVSLICTLAAPPVSAQDRFFVPSPILVVDEAALFAQSDYGKQVEADLTVARDALIAENRRIEAELATEERDLTERRPTMEPAAFREEAAAFDAKVVELRRAQDLRVQALNNRRDSALREFDTIVRPILSSIAIERGAVAVVKKESLLISANSIDITAEVIRRIDDKLSEDDTDAQDAVDEDQEETP